MFPKKSVSCLGRKYQIPSKDIAAFGNKEDSLIITVESDKEELFDTNNNAYFYYEKQPVKSIQISNTNIELDTIGDTECLEVSVLPKDAETVDVEWISENENVATVTTNGAVTAVANGETVVKAVSIDGSDIVAKCEVTVKDTTVKATATPEITPEITAEITATPEVTSTPKVTETPIKNQMIIYYANSNWSKAYIHYKVGNGAWTDVPGIRMGETSEQSGYRWKYVIDLEKSDNVTMCFNNGEGSWDNNNKADYKITGAGSFGIKSGAIIKLVSSTTEEPQITATPKITETPTKNEMTIYYANDSWSKAYIHYKVGNGAWTDVPGMRMGETSEQSGYKWKYVIDLGTSDNVTMCFNNGEGSWDNNNKADYKITGAGVYGIKNQKITKLLSATNTPAVTSTPKVTKTPEVTATPKITATPEIIKTPIVNVTPSPKAEEKQITIYFDSDKINYTSDVDCSPYKIYIHYKKTSEDRWKTDNMTPTYEKNNYRWKYTFTLEETEKVDCWFSKTSSFDGFDREKGLYYWVDIDDNEGKYYTFSDEGIYGLNNGIIKSLQEATSKYYNRCIIYFSDSRHDYVAMNVRYRANSTTSNYYSHMVKTSDVSGYDYAIELNGLAEELHFEYIFGYMGETKVPYVTTYGLPRFGYIFKDAGVYGVKDGKVVCLDDLDDPENSMY